MSAVAMRLARGRLALLLTFVLFATGERALGQADAPFAGRWILVSAKPVRPDYVPFWLGHEFVVRQSAAALQITRNAPAPSREAAFVLGKESQNVYDLDGRKTVHDSRATIRDGVLIVSTETTRGTEMRRLSHIMRWSLDADGLLTITDTQICGHGECPSIVTTLRYKRE
jgi:hypothetical protein